MVGITVKFNINIYVLGNIIETSGTCIFLGMTQGVQKISQSNYISFVRFKLTVYLFCLKTRQPYYTHYSSLQGRNYSV